ncbi:MAG: hypothetical protein MJ096_05080 [Clostridia bacterium]|nr:hypothetical protein [Clostridia bacterium]
MISDRLDTITVSGKKKTLFIAHRGLSGIETENTAAAFVAAANRSYFGIETDVHVTADGKYVLMHDAHTGRVADRDIDIGSSTLEELRAIAIKDKNGDTDRADLCIPLLKDYAKICKKYGKAAILELKDEFTDEQLEDIYNICKEQGEILNTVFISFYYSDVKRMKEKHPDVNCQFLTGEINDKILADLDRDNIDLDVYYMSLNKKWVKKCHKLDIAVNCWTVDHPADAENLISMGVDFITSNILE